MRSGSIMHELPEIKGVVLGRLVLRKNGRCHRASAPHRASLRLLSAAFLSIAAAALARGIRSRSPPTLGVLLAEGGSVACILSRQRLLRSSSPRTCAGVSPPPDFVQVPP